MSRYPRLSIRLFCATIGGIGLMAFATAVMLKSTAARADVSRRHFPLERGPLTGVAARIAIVDMLKQRKAMGPHADTMAEHYLAALDPIELARSSINKNDDGTFVVGGILVDPKKKYYGFEVGSTKCRFTYEGSFEWINGAWRATLPLNTWRGCSR